MKKFIVIFVAVIVAIALTIPAYAQNPAAAKPQEKCLLKRGRKR